MSNPITNYKVVYNGVDVTSSIIDLGDKYVTKEYLLSTYSNLSPTLTSTELYTWGDNTYGQLGLGDVTNRTNPVQVGTDTDWLQVSTGYTHSLAIKKDGTLWSAGQASQFFSPYTHHGWRGLGEGVYDTINNQHYYEKVVTDPEEKLFTTGGVYTNRGLRCWRCPLGVTSVSVITVGGGSKGSVDGGSYFGYENASAGGGGNLRYVNNIPVVPNEYYYLYIGLDAGALRSYPQVDQEVNSVSYYAGITDLEYNIDGDSWFGRTELFNTTDLTGTISNSAIIEPPNPTYRWRTYFASRSSKEYNNNYANDIANLMIDVVGIRPTTAGVYANLINYSEDFSNSSWTKTNVNIEAPISTDVRFPFSTKVTENTNNGNHSIRQTQFSTYTGIQCASIFLKAGTNQYAFLSVTSNGNTYTVVYDLISGSVTDTHSIGSMTNKSSNIEVIGPDGWYRVSLTRFGSSSYSIVYGLCNSGTPTYDSNGIPTYTGTSKYMYAYGAQLEIAPAPTTYVATDWIFNSSKPLEVTINFPSSGDYIFRVADVGSDRCNWRLDNSANENSGSGNSPTYHKINVSAGYHTITITPVNTTSIIGFQILRNNPSVLARGGHPYGLVNTSGNIGTGGNGGPGGLAPESSSLNSSYLAPGGGGAGGYIGDGGAGGYGTWSRIPVNVGFSTCGYIFNASPVNGEDGQGGGGGGGGASLQFGSGPTGAGGAGAGVGVYGIGENGKGAPSLFVAYASGAGGLGVLNTCASAQYVYGEGDRFAVGGLGGSGGAGNAGQTIFHSDGFAYGGGGGGTYDFIGGFSRGGDGVVRVVWPGTTRQFPSTDVGLHTYDRDWKTCSAGTYFSMAIKQNGTLWGFGFNKYGQLGYGDKYDKYYATKIGTDDNWKLVSAGSRHSVMIKNDGSLWSCGDNTYGQLGVGDTTERLVPTQVGTDTDWISISAASKFSVALKIDGTMWVWGSEVPVNKGVYIYTSPIQVGTDSDWKYISCLNQNFNEGHTNDSDLALRIVAIKNDGTLWYVTTGQFANGLDANPQITISQIGLDNDWKKVVATGDSSNYIFHGLKTNGSLWYWKKYTNDNQFVPTMLGTDYAWTDVTQNTRSPGSVYALKDSACL